MNDHTFHPDFVNLTNEDLAAIAADPAITLTVRGYAHADLCARLLAEYQAAVDHKYDDVNEGTESWAAADRRCDELCMAYVVASHAKADFLESRVDNLLADYYGAP